MITTVKRLGVLVALGLAAVLVVPTGAASAKTATPRQGYAYTVVWSDGVSIGEPRTFSKRQYRDAANLPYIQVKASCRNGAVKGDVIKMQFRYQGKWYNDSSVRVGNCNNRYALRLNPYTEDGRWASGSYRYRVILAGAGSQALEFDVTYTR